MPTNSAQPPIRSRSAVAPVTSAGVMTANIIWYATKASSGIATPGLTTCRAGAGALSRFCMPKRLKSPKSPPPASLPNAML
jgi:hypothetical protein